MFAVESLRQNKRYLNSPSVRYPMELGPLLQEVGLSEKEAKVYLVLLSLGPSTVNMIAERSDLIRTTTYDILKSLREKGIVASLVKNRILHFEAADPQKLIESLDAKKQKIQEALPELRKLRQFVTEGPTLELYEGVEGIRTIWQDILGEKQPLLAFSNYESVFNTLKYFSPRFIQQRVTEKIPAKLLTEKTPGAIETWKKKDKQELRETRFLPALERTKITEYIYGDKVAILSTDPQNPLGIIVRHADFAKQQTVLFEMLWKQAQP